MKMDDCLNPTQNYQITVNSSIKYTSLANKSSQDSKDNQEGNQISQFELEKNIDNQEHYSSPSSSVIEEEINPNLKLQKTKTKYSNFTDYNTDELNYMKRDKNKKTSNIIFYDKMNINFLRIFTIIIIILYIVLGITSNVVFQIRKDTDPFLFCFKFISRDQEIKSDENDYETIFFLTDVNSFYIIHIVLLFIFISILITLFRNNPNEIKKFFKDISIFLNLTLICNMPIFFIGMFENSFYKGGSWKSVIFVILTAFGSICMLKIYIQTKKHKYKKASEGINQNILSGALGGFEVYCLIYNICFLVSSSAESVRNRYEIEIIGGIVYFVIGFLAISFFKDIFFPISMLILQIGLLYIKKNTSIATVLVNIGIVFLNFSSVLLTIFKYNKKVYRLVELNKNEN